MEGPCPGFPLGQLGQEPGALPLGQLGKDNVPPKAEHQGRKGSRGREKGKREIKIEHELKGNSLLGNGRRGCIKFKCKQICVVLKRSVV